MKLASRKKLLRFIFGSTALATSMNFFPLAEVHARSIDVMNDVQESMFSQSHSHSAFHTKSLDSANEDSLYKYADLRSLLNLDPIGDAKKATQYKLVDIEANNKNSDASIANDNDFQDDFEIPEELTRGVIFDTDGDSFDDDSFIDPSLLTSVFAAGYSDQFDEVKDKDGNKAYSPKPSRRNSLNLDPNADSADTPATTKVGVFSIDDGIEMARYAQASYAFANPEDSADIQRFQREGSKVYTLKPLKKDVSWTETTIENQDTGIFVERADGTAVIAFKGSDRVNTWASDFNPVMVNHADGGRYHSGFLTMYNELEASMWNHIMNFAEKNGYSIEEAMEKITFTGHSRGAGCAQVAADIASRKTKTVSGKRTVSKMVTFAAPRALHKHTAGEFNEAAKDKHLNILQAKDVVGYAALSSLNGGAHTGHKVYLPVERDSWIHMMSGYRKMLNTLKFMGEVKRDPNSKTGNTYRFESANADEKRDLLKEKDNSLQAWVESAGNAVLHPVEAAQHIGGNVKWAIDNPEEAVDAAADSLLQGGANVGEVIGNAGRIGKLAAVGATKKIASTITGSKDKIAVEETENAAPSTSFLDVVKATPSFVYDSAKSLGSSVISATGNFIFGTDAVLEDDASLDKRQADANARQAKFAKEFEAKMGQKPQLEELNIERKEISPATKNVASRAWDSTTSMAKKAFNAVKFW